MGEFIRRCRERGLKFAVASPPTASKSSATCARSACREDLERLHHRQRRAAEEAGPGNLPRRRRRLGLRAEDCLVIEDAVNGIRAGKSAGAECLGLTTKFDAATLRAAGADWTAPDLAHAPEEIFAGEASSGTGS